MTTITTLDQRIKAISNEIVELNSQFNASTTAICDVFVELVEFAHSVYIQRHPDQLMWMTMIAAKYDVDTENFIEDTKRYFHAATNNPKCSLRTLAEVISTMRPTRCTFENDGDNVNIHLSRHVIALTPYFNPVIITLPVELFETLETGPLTPQWKSKYITHYTSCIRKARSELICSLDQRREASEAAEALKLIDQLQRLGYDTTQVVKALTTKS